MIPLGNSNCELIEVEVCFKGRSWVAAHPFGKGQIPKRVHQKGRACGRRLRQADGELNQGKPRQKFWFSFLIVGDQSADHGAGSIGSPVGEVPGYASFVPAGASSHLSTFLLRNCRTSTSPSPSWSEQTKKTGDCVRKPLWCQRRVSSTARRSRSRSWTRTSRTSRLSTTTFFSRRTRRRWGRISWRGIPNPSMQRLSS